MGKTILFSAMIASLVLMTNFVLASPNAEKENLGIPACDLYVANFTRCLDKIPGTAKTSMKMALDNSIQGWKTSLDQPGVDKAAIAQTCIMASTAAKQAMTAFQCDWPSQ